VNTHQIDSAVDRIKKKMVRWESDPEAERARYYMRLAYANVLWGNHALAQKLACEAGEGDLASTSVFPPRN
jgi:hypothetical protein